MAPTRDNRLKEIRESGVVLSQKDIACLLTHRYLPEGESIDHTTVSKHESGRGLTSAMIEAYTRLYKLDQGDRPGSVLIFMSPDDIEEDSHEE